MTLLKQMEIHDYGSTFRVLLVGFACTFFVWYAKFHWDRRKLYGIASTVPGPRGYPVIGSALEVIGSPTTSFSNMSNLFVKYAPFGKVWMGHKLIFTISKPEHLEIVVNSPHCLEKDNVYKYMRRLFGTGLVTAPVGKWKRTRKVINPTFNPKILESFVCIFAEHSNVLVEELKKFTGSTSFDAFPAVASFTFSSVCETVLGMKSNNSTSEQKYGKWLDQALSIICLRMNKIWYHFDFIFDRTRNGKIFHDVLNKIQKFTNKVIVEKRDTFESRMKLLESGLEVEAEDVQKRRKAFLDLLVELSYKTEKLSIDELRQEVNTITAAGSDTTAASICFICIMLGMHPNIQAKVFDELIDVLGYDRTVTAEDLPKLKYLERVIKETLRLFPIAPFVGRVVQADLHLDEYTLPAGTSVFLGFFHTHRSALYWEEPLKFNPDRFLPEEVSKRHPYSYLPFSGGSRNCIGGRYAMMSMKTAISTVVRKYIIGTTYRSVEDIKLFSNIVLRPTQGFQLSLEERE